MSGWGHERHFKRRLSASGITQRTRTNPNHKGDVPRLFGSDAYISGPICVAESERGHGLATALFAELRERLPERECVAFVRRDNAASLRAHLKMGMKDVASFEHDGVAHAVLAFAAPRRA